jgi:hypothetical protein
VTESQSGNPISNAQIRLSHPMITHTGLTNGLGDESLTLYYQDSYELTVGKWSYQSVCTTLVITASTQDITIELPKGYYDDFEFDFGWSVIGNAATGMWERGVPFPTTNTVTSPDADWDCGKQAMLTGNAPAVNPDVDDVDNGFTTLISPIFDLAGLTTPVLNYARSFYCYHGPGLFNDSLIISLSNGLQTIVIDQVGAPQGNLMSFNYVSIPLTGLLPFTNTMQLFIRIADDAANPNITEGGFDHFVLTNEPIAALSQSQQTSTFQLVPNPGSQSFRVAGIQNEAQLSIYSATGALVGTQTITPLQTDISTSDWPEGLYFIEIDTQVLRWVKIAQ